MKKLLSKFSPSKGFTPIELLIVIAILGVLAAVLIALLDPGDKIKAANDTKVLQDIREVYGANQRYVSLNSANGTIATLVSSGELKLFPSAPTGFAAYVMVNSSTVGVTDVVVGGEVQSKSARSKSTTSNTIGGVACVGTAATGTCYFVMTQNKSCYKYNATPASAVPVAADVCP